MTNAHLLPDQHAILSAYLNGASISKVAESYTRPAALGNHPDITEAHVVSDHKGIATMFPNDESHDDSLFFYYTPNHRNGQYRFVVPIDDPDSHGLLAFRPEGKEMPQAGASGSPIIQAKVFIVHGKPVWRFISIGTLFAKHETQPRLYAAPIAPERQQILSIKLALEERDRCQELALAAHALGDDQSIRFHLNNMQYAQTRAYQQSADYHAGSTEIPVQLPNGLVPLQGSRILPLSLSYWLTNGGDKRLYKKKWQKEVEITEDLIKEYKDLLLDEIKEDAAISLQENADCEFDNDFMHLDIKICSGGGYTLVEVQDKCRDQCARPLKLPRSNKAASSTFAIAKIYGTSLIDGKTLVAILKHSLEASKTVIFVPENKEACDAKKSGAGNTTGRIPLAPSRQELEQQEALAPREKKNPTKTVNGIKIECAQGSEVFFDRETYLPKIVPAKVYATPWLDELGYCLDELQAVTSVPESEEVCEAIKSGSEKTLHRQPSLDKTCTLFTKRGRSCLKENESMDPVQNSMRAKR